MLIWSWLADRGTLDVDRSTVVRGYELVMASVAFGYLVATHVIAAGRARFTDRVLGHSDLTGLDGLAAVLRELLRDPELEILRWHGAAIGYTDGSGRPRDPELSDRSWLPISDGGVPLGAIEHRSSELADEPTAVAVAAATTLAVRHQLLQEQLAAQLDELEAARTRLVEAADRQRTLVAGRLQADVVSPLARTTSELRTIAPAIPPGEAADAIGVVVQELGAVAAEVVTLVGGAPPTSLGSGRLRDAVEALAVRSPVPVTVTATGLIAADPAAETALFYVCSEALANAVKHAGANQIEISIRGDERAVRARRYRRRVRRRRPLGSGLLGLADRLATARRPAPGGQPTRSRHDRDGDDPAIARRSADSSPGLYDPCGGVAVARVAERERVAFERPGHRVRPARPTVAVLVRHRELASGQLRQQLGPIDEVHACFLSRAGRRPRALLRSCHCAPQSMVGLSSGRHEMA